MKARYKGPWTAASTLVIAGFLTCVFLAFSAASAGSSLEPEVQRFVKSCGAVFALWREAEAGESETYVDLENRPAFRRYNVIRGDAIVGYLIAASESPGSTGKLTLVEFGVSTPPDVLLLPGTKEAAQQAVGSKMLLGTGRFMYTGFGQYFFCYDYSEGTRSVGTITIDALTKKAVGGTLSPHYPDGLQAWQLQRAGENPEAGGRERFYAIPGVPQFKHHCTDQATAIGMLFGYWAENGFPNLRRRLENGDRESNEQMVEVIAELCGTCSDRTAIELFASSRGYRARNHTHSLLPHRHLEQMPYSRYASHINDGIPLLITVGTPGIARYFTAVGYLQMEGERFLVTLSASHDNTTSPHSRQYVFLNWDAAFNDVLVTAILPEEAE